MRRRHTDRERRRHEASRKRRDLERLDFVEKAVSRSISADGFWTENAAGRAPGLVARKLCGLRIKQA